MTIRDFLRARRRRWLYGVTLFAGLMLAGLWQTSAVATEDLGQWRRALAAVGAIGLMVLLGAQFVLLRCPRCTRFLGPELRVYLARPINYCPYCGVHLDEKLDAPPRG